MITRAVRAQNRYVQYDCREFFLVDELTKPRIVY